jgi:fumarylacetoacetase
MTLDPTHDPDAMSWIESANAPSCDFPLQNLPFACFAPDAGAPARGGIAIGDQIVDLVALHASGLLAGDARDAAAACCAPVLNDFMALGAPAWRALRRAVFALLSTAAGEATRDGVRACLLPQAQAYYRLPARIGDYTDFYTSVHHAYNAGLLVRPNDPLAPNFRWLPVAYHGRASSVCVGVLGEGVRRPNGQRMPPGAAAPEFGPSTRLDYELELGAFMGPGNALGEPIAVADAEDHLFGLCLLNDWSARDIQFWEMAPLGPFLGKNFCTTVSPWIVTMDALRPFRRPWQRAADEPQPLPHLAHPRVAAAGALDIQLSVGIETEAHRRVGARAAEVSRTSFVHQYWTLAQMVAHHTSGGCNLAPGDLIGTGTISGPMPDEAGCLLERTRGGREPLLLPVAGEAPQERAFLADGDAVELHGWCEQPGARRIGFGCNRAVVRPARTA